MDNDGAGCRKLLAWAQAKSGAEPTGIRMVMESSGFYHEQAAEYLHDAGCSVVVANPKRVRDFARGLGFLTKTDAVDAKGLARYGEQGDAQARQPPVPEIRTLRALLARLAEVAEDLQREQNRLEKAQIAQTPELVRDSLLRSIERLIAEHARLRSPSESSNTKNPTTPLSFPKSLDRQDGIYWGTLPSKKSIKRLKERIHAETKSRWNALPVSMRIDELNPVLRGWANYFSQGPVSHIYRDIDNYTARRIRIWLRRRSGQRGTGYRQYSDQHLYETLGLIRLLPPARDRSNAKS